MTHEARAYLHTTVAHGPSGEALQVVVFHLKEYIGKCSVALSLLERLNPDLNDEGIQQMNRAKAACTEMLDLLDVEVQAILVPRLIEQDRLLKKQ